MAKFNVVQKRRRALIAQNKRALHGDPLTGKLRNKPQPLSVSGKRKRKLLKKWRREQKEALEKGLVTMKDVEMAVAQGEDSFKDGNTTPARFHIKKGLNLKRLKYKGKRKGKSKLTAGASADAMEE
ncbi:hypothetical protein K2173_026495 [Erythroxylum novogranatense]|uniref:Uncharacterized protein n=1 Tax=Erythroxylum novogranatense TaxID=1862640 RepID=A0AAV8U061_9ROSI|nr:hypothetical protein K2173_026495 [Erythroxylum novogranatense]